MKKEKYALTWRQKKHVAYSFLNGKLANAQRLKLKRYETPFSDNSDP